MSNAPRIRNPAILAASFVALCACAWPLLAQKPPTDPLCALENTRFRVDFLRGGYCCPNELEFWVEDKDGGRQGRLRVATRMRKAEHMTLLAHSKLFVTGLLQRGAMALAVVDVENSVLQDELHAFDYRLSPSQTRLVYSRHYGEGASADERRPLLLLYDLTGSAADNRAGVPAALDTSNAGRPIYPETNARRGSYEPFLEAAHRYLSPFLWSRDEGAIVFVEAFDGKLWLVKIDLSEDGEAPRVAKKPLAREELSPDQTPTPTAGAGLPVAYVRWKDDSTVEVQALIDGVLQDAVDIAVP